MKNRLVTVRQALLMAQLGFNEKTACTAPKKSGKSVWINPLLYVPTVDEAIDWIRRKFNIVIYDSFEPFVDPTDKNGHITYGYSVKFCDTKFGWNGRIYIGRGRNSYNVYAAKRNAIVIALKYIKNAKRRRCRPNRAKKVHC